jgi:hypothetical protein
MHALKTWRIDAEAERFPGRPLMAQGGRSLKGYVS